jgi:hypothetical protein
MKIEVYIIVDNSLNTMCDMCYGYMYDVIMSPLHTNHVLHKHIHQPLLLQHAEEITHCFQRALNTFDNDPLFFIIMDESDECITAEMDYILKEQCEDKWVWTKFSQLYPCGAVEVKYAIQICLDNYIFRKTSEPTKSVEAFLIDRLRLFLSMIPDIHMSHTVKCKLEPYHSLGPVSLDEIANIRSKLGLPVSNWERVAAIDNIIRNL